MKAITIKQPWANLIIRGGKDIENRTWPTSYRGLVLIHASKKFDRAEFIAAEHHCASRGIQTPEATVILSPTHGFACGGVIGIAEITDCVTKHDSPWFVGPYGFVLANARRITSHECRGSLGLWECAYPYAKSLEDAINSIKKP